MTAYGDFSSLLQLGVGIGIGLSLFRAPVDLRIAYIQHHLDSEIAALRGITTEFGRLKRRQFLELKLRFTREIAIVERLLKPFMVLAVLGAVLNLGALVFVSLNAHLTPSTCAKSLILFISVVYFLLVIGSLELLARWRFSKFRTDLENIQSKANSNPIGS